MKDDPMGWTVTDDWAEQVPVTEAEIDVLEAWFGNLFDIPAGLDRLATARVLTHSTSSSESE
jgi:hypothetical protein